MRSITGRKPSNTSASFSGVAVSRKPAHRASVDAVSGVMGPSVLICASLHVGQLARGRRQSHAAVFGDKDRVLDLEAHESKLVVRRLDLEHHAGLKGGRRRLVE